MKKAYVKPVFAAEVFESTESVAACTIGSSDPYAVWKGDFICTHGNNGHKVDHTGKAPVSDYWGYATNGHSKDGTEISNADTNTSSMLFNSGRVECDFVWNSYSGPVGVWTEDGTTNTVISDMNNRVVGQETGNSIIAWLGDLMNFFRGNGSGCGDLHLFDENNNPGVPFS